MISFMLYNIPRTVRYGEYFFARFGNMNQKIFFSLRYKIMLAFFGIGCVTSIVLGQQAYKILEEKLFSELRRNVENITHIGSAYIDEGAVARLIARQQEGATPAQRDAVESSPEYKAVYDQLNFIRNTEQALIRYVYLLTPTDDPEVARYLVDADVLQSKAAGLPDEEISRFNSDMDVEPFPVLQQAMREGKDMVEQNYVYDEAFKVNTVSGYAPVFSADGQRMLALLGLDMADSQVQAALAEALQKSIAVGLLSLLASLLTAVLIGTWFTRGIIRLDSLVRSFAEKDFAVRASLKSNDEVGRLGFSFNHMAETIQDYNTRLTALAEAYGRFVPHDLLRLLEKDSILDVNLGDQIQKDMSVLFSDIRNFTAISETMSPKENFDYINSYLRQVGPEIRAHRGIIDKYIGDAVMALFPGKVDDAVDAALVMQRKVREYNEYRDARHYPEIKIGIGVHNGNVMLGTIGEDMRMDGTVISDTVNLASRLEGLTKKYGCKIVVSDRVLQKMDNPEKYFTRMIDKVCVVGKNDPVVIYEVCDADEATVMAFKRVTLSDYVDAIKQYYAQDFTAAAASFSKVLAVNDHDVPARIFLERSQRFIADGVPADWNGVSRLDSKG